MITIFLSVFLLLFVNFGNGVLMFTVLKFKTRSFSMTSFLGMMSITCFQTIISFFRPLDDVTEIAVITLGLIGLITLIKRKEVSLFIKAIKLNYWFALLGLLVIYAASFSPYFFDHYSYYVPTISYIKQIGLVRGVSNVDFLLGQSSFWHIYQAGFSSIVDADLRVNAYLLILFLLYTFENRRWALLLFLPFFLIFVQQPSPDLPVFLLSLIIINELIDGRNSIFIISLSLFACGIKPTVFWLPMLLIMESFYTGDFKVKSMIPIIGFGLLFSLKNIWLFGFPLFPSSLLDLGLPWKPSEEIRMFSSQIGLMKSYDMKYTYQQVASFSPQEKVYHWFTIGVKSVFNGLIIICLLILAYFSFKKKDKIYYLIFVAFMVKFIMIVLFSAQYRFFIDLYLVTFFLIFRTVSEEKAVLFSVFLSLLVSSIFTLPGFVKGGLQTEKWLQGFSWRQLYTPNNIDFNNDIEHHQIGNFKFNVPHNPFQKQVFPSLNINDLKLYQYYGVFPQNADKGFIQRKLTLGERSELQHIITNLERPKH